MQNKPNLPYTQMNVSSVLIEDYENDNVFLFQEKQTQSKPILSASGGFKPDLVKMGHHEDMFWIFCCKMGGVWLQYVQLSPCH